MSSIMGQIHPENPEFFALELRKKMLKMTWFTLYHLQTLTNHTKLGQSVNDHKISDEFDYGTNRTSTVRVVCP